MNEPLKCICGSRRLIRTEVIGTDGNPWTGPWDEVFKCPGCERALKMMPDGEHNMKLEVVILHSSITAWRSL